MKFNDLFINDRIKKALIDLKYNVLTEVQEEAIPLIFDEEDIIVKASTGSGKTGAFMIPIINNIIKTNDRFKPQALILVPTRELALQIHENTMSYAKYTNIRSLAIIGGVKESYQKQKLNQGVDIIIATPGRLIDLLKQKVVNMKLLKYLVVDEADKLLDMGFVNDINLILKYLPNRQTLLFSATLNDGVEELSNLILNYPKKVAIDSKEIKVKQEIYFIDQLDKLYLLKDIIKQEKIESVLVFCRTKLAAEKTSNFLRGNNIPSDFIVKDKSQIERTKALNKLKNKEIQALVATDIASRGIDVEYLSNVINFDMPNDLETYIHRIGRTARNKRNGVATSFCSKQEIPIYDKIKKDNNFTIVKHKYKGVN